MTDIPFFSAKEMTASRRLLEYRGAHFPDSSALLVSEVVSPAARQRRRILSRPGFRPEQYGFRQSDARTDIFALGRLVEWMFPGDFSMMVLAEKATRMDPADRFANIEEFRHVLQAAEKTPPEDLSDEEALDRLYADEYHFCPNCEAVLEEQAGFDPSKGVWKCKNCGMQLFGDEAGDTGDYNTGVIWYCDCCGALLNNQKGFDYYADSWICRECGFENDISENNIRPSRK